jgi:hypothetical protein
MIETVFRQEVTSAGGSEFIDLAVPYTLYEFYTNGEITLSANYSVSAPTPPDVSVTLRMLYRGNINLSSYSVDILGLSLTQAQLKSNCYITAIYDILESPAVWRVFVEVDNTDLTQVIKGTGDLTVPNTGTYTLYPGVDKNYQRSSNAVALTGNTNVSISTVDASPNDWFYHYHDGGVTLGAYTFEICGINIPEYDALNGGFAVYSYFDEISTSWKSVKVSGSITADLIPDGIIDPIKFAEVPAYSVYMNTTGSLAQPTSVAALAPDQVLTGSGFNFLGLNNFDFGILPDSLAFINISAAEILDAFSTPINLLPTPTAGTYNIVKSVFMTTTYGSTPYDTNIDIELGYAGLTEKWAVVPGVLDFTGNIEKIFYPENSATNTSNINSSAFQLSVPTANPLTGDSTLSFIIVYSNVSFPLP